MFLGINTINDICNVCLAKDGVLLREQKEYMLRGQSEAIIPMLTNVLAQTKISDLKGIAIVHGPGNYTGIRIGIAAAMGLALAWNIPLYGIDSRDPFKESICASSIGKTIPLNPNYL